MTISIITITFNAAHCLQRTLDSVAAQTCRDIEHIIVDGASTDATVDIAQAYAAKADYPVRITSEKDEGLYYAMNKGLFRATGDYVVFLNAGDCLAAPDTIATVAALASEPATSGNASPAVVYGRTDITDASGRFLCHRRLAPPRRLGWRSFMHGMLVCHQAFYARADIARATLYDTRYRYSADVDWCIRVMKKAARGGLPLADAGAVLALYMQEGTTTRHHSESLRERFRVMCAHYGLAATVAMHAWFALRSAIH